MENIKEENLLIFFKKQDIYFQKKKVLPKLLEIEKKALKLKEIIDNSNDAALKENLNSLLTTINNRKNQLKQ